MLHNNVRATGMGFSLIELIITVALLAIGMLLTIPSFTGFTQSNRLVTQTQELQMALQYARSEAIRLNTSVLFCQSANGESCAAPDATEWVGWIILRVENGLDDDNAEVLRAGRFDDGVLKISSGETLANAQHTIRFNSQGLIRASNSNTPLASAIVVCLPNSDVKPNRYSLNFNSGGHQKIETSDTSGVCI